MLYYKNSKGKVMKKKQKITISYQGSDYSVEVLKLLKVISYLKDESIKEPAGNGIYPRAAPLFPQAVIRSPQVNTGC